MLGMHKLILNYKIQNRSYISTYLILASLDFLCINISRVNLYTDVAFFFFRLTLSPFLSSSQMFI